MKDKFVGWFKRRKGYADITSNKPYKMFKRGHQFMCVSDRGGEHYISAASLKDNWEKLVTD